MYMLKMKVFYVEDYEKLVATINVVLLFMRKLLLIVVVLSLIRFFFLLRFVLFCEICSY
jgi:hypothetical protein